MDSDKYEFELKRIKQDMDSNAETAPQVPFKIEEKVKKILINRSLSFDNIKYSEEVNS